MRWQQVKGRQEVEGNVFENGDGYMKVQWMKVYMPCKFMNSKLVCSTCHTLGKGDVVMHIYIYV